MRTHGSSPLSEARPRTWINFASKAWHRGGSDFKSGSVNRVRQTETPSQPNSMFSEIIGFDFNFPAEYLRAALILSLLTVWVLVGLFFYLNLYTRRRYFTLWTAAWLFYSLWLTLCIAVSGENDHPMLSMFKHWCISASAVCLLWGSSVFHNLKSRQTMFGLFIAFLFVWSYVGSVHFENLLLTQLPVFSLIGNCVSSR